MEIPRPRAPAPRNERIAGRVLSSVVALTTTYFFVLLYDMVSPVVFAAVDTAGEPATRATTRRSASGSLIMIVLAYAVWVSFGTCGRIGSALLPRGIVRRVGGQRRQAVFALRRWKPGRLAPARADGGG